MLGKSDAARHKSNKAILTWWMYAKDKTILEEIVPEKRKRIENEIGGCNRADIEIDGE